MKKILKDIRFLIAVFVLIFVVFGGAAANASISRNGLPVLQSSSQPEAYTSALYFKAPVLRLNATSNPNTSFLVITNQAAIVETKVFGASVDVDISEEFTIIVLRTGQSQVHLSARMRSGEIRTITCTVVVEGAASGGTNGGAGNNDGNVGGGGGDDSAGDTTPPITGVLSYEFETALVIAFGLVIEEEDIFLFRLSATVIRGDISVRIVGNVARITRETANPNFEIRFTATIDGHVIATEYVQNRL